MGLTCDAWGRPNPNGTDGGPVPAGVTTAMDRTDAFEIALEALRDSLREGEFPPGTRIPASKLADALQLSATPIREALSRLAGEGLVEERRQQGFFVRTLTSVDIADLYRLSLSHLMISQGQRTALGQRDAPAIPHTDLTDPIRRVEGLLLAWMAGASATLMSSYRTLVIQLGPVRRIEHLVLADLDAEAAGLAALHDPEAAPQWLTALRRFHGRRIAVADRLASAVNRPDRRQKI